MYLTPQGTITMSLKSGLPCRAATTGTCEVVIHPKGDSKKDLLLAGILRTTHELVMHNYTHVAIEEARYSRQDPRLAKKK